MRAMYHHSSSAEPRTQPEATARERERGVQAKQLKRKKICKAIPHSGSKTVSPEREAERQQRVRKASDGRLKKLSLVETSSQLLGKLTVLLEELSSGKPYIHWLKQKLENQHCAKLCSQT